MLEHPDITRALRTGYADWEALSDEAPSFYCEKCGAEIDEEQSAYGLCAKCEAAALLRFKAMLLTFTQEERKYLDACVEGTSLTDPQNIKPVKAVYP